MRPLAFALVLLAALVASCTKPRPRPDEVVFWEPWPASIVAPMVARFEADNPSLHVSVRRIALATMNDSLAVALAAGHPPDLCAIASGDMPRWLSTNVLSDWSAGVAGLRDSLRGWELCSVGDALYGLPLLLNPRVLLCNTALFERAGLDAGRPPETWAQLRSAALKLQKLGHGVHGFGLSVGDSLESAAEFLSFAWGNGGEVFSARLDSSRFDSSEMLETLQFYLSLRRAALMAGSDTLLHEFDEGRLGMLVTGADTFAGRGPRAAAGSIALLPRPGARSGTHAAYADGVVLASFTASRRKEAALRLARVLAEPAGLRAMSALLRDLQPATADSDSTALPLHATIAQVLARQRTTAHFAPPVAHWDSIRTAIGFQVGEALLDRKSAADALADADARIAALAGRR